MRHARTSPDRAFTMIELIVVVVILAVLAGAIVPRVAGWTRRDAQGAALAAGEVLSAAARREMLSSQPVALDFDAARASLRLRVLQQGAWREDPLVPDADLAGAQLAQAFEGTALLASESWRVEFRAGEPRPPLALVLRGDAGRDAWRVDLPSGAAQATVTRGDQPPEGLAPVDLDGSGREDQPW